MNALRAGMQVSVYHFARWSSPSNAVTEAQFFLNQVLSFGFDQSTIMVVDCETNDYGLNGGTYQACVNSWLGEVRKHFKKTAVYGSISWFTSGMLNSHNFGNAFNWVAGYGVDSLGIDNASAWQFSDKWNGCDASYDFVGDFTSAKIEQQAKPQQPNNPSKTVVIHKGDEVIIRGE